MLRVELQPSYQQGLDLSTDNIPEICLRFTAKPPAFRIAGVSLYFTAQLQDFEITL